MKSDKKYMKTSALFFLLFFSANVLAQNKDKTLIDTAQINYVEILKVNFGKPETSAKKKLSKSQSADFSIKWNNAKAMGADKYKMTYYICVYLKNGDKRQFTIADNKIQEQGWLTFDIGDKLYFDKLWSAVK